MRKRIRVARLIVAMIRHDIDVAPALVIWAFKVLRAAEGERA